MVNTMRDNTASNWPYDRVFHDKHRIYQHLHVVEIFVKFL